MRNSSFDVLLHHPEFKRYLCRCEKYQEFLHHRTH